MKPETIKKLQYHLSTLSHDSLEEFLAMVVQEMYRRTRKGHRPQKAKPFWELKDCGPNHGD